MVEGSVSFPQRIIKAAPSKALVLRINLLFLAFFIIIYAVLLLRPSLSTYHENAAYLVRCSFSECHPKGENGVKVIKAVIEEPNYNSSKGNNSTSNKLEVLPNFLKEIGKGKKKKIGMVNMDEEDVNEWNTRHKNIGEAIPIHFDHVTDFFKWEDLFPEWVDEEEESEVPSCPEIPMPDFDKYKKMDVILAKLPCMEEQAGAGRNVFRLQVHLVVANLAVKKWKRKEWNRGKSTKVVFWSKCRPMLELFRCNDLVKREGNWWFYEPDMTKLDQKVSLPIGSCKLAMPIWGQGIDDVYDPMKTQKTTKKKAKREAYATVLHSSESYVCGAITLAQSLRASGTTRDLLILIDNSISQPKRAALARSGWKIRTITRIRNPRAENGSYNEYNYSKFRLWQLTDYDKLIFIDADIIVLRNLDVLFQFPQMTAVGNDFSLFNSGIMVLEPSNCTFQVFMESRNDIISYNGGDQGFLNELFVWWHRLPRRVNFLKNFWSNSSENEISFKNELFKADPPKVYAIHYLGWKPWLCYRDYDCNWDVEESFVYASDVAHQRWWKVHDAMDEKLQRFCRLTKRRRTELEWERRVARKKGLVNGHWRINITDPRRSHLVL
ncbi:UDP-glucuronate:xylan alpha-glucuronosyltransferase 2 isoform X1 [Cannabis sativa]|uniref:UDP-glucuronate:xylan alpha-glucuronosyltransferase 2 isoform X1 n=1 Tax=Cannabis sativa TaxID=3483 RepID=UPI0029C9F1C6|nr:UDP-glucuronate:xylan alpha-glucuronosyltransferase 2 isoform X1 [Cannabis sativa]